MEITAAHMALEKLGREFDTINLCLNIIVFAICLYLLWRVKQANGYHREAILSTCKEVTMTPAKDTKRK